MDSKYCTRCTPLPKIERPVSLRRGTNQTGSHEIQVSAKLVDTLCKNSTDPAMLRALLCANTLPEFGTAGDPGCIFYRPPSGKTWERAVPVEMTDGRRSLTSAPRAAFAACFAKLHTGERLMPGEHAVHQCQTEIYDDIRLCCVNPIHIVGK